MTAVQAGHRLHYSVFATFFTEMVANSRQTPADRANELPQDTTTRILAITVNAR